MEELYRRIDADPEFHALSRRRSRLSWALTAVVALSFYSWIFVIAFRPAWFAQTLGPETVLTVGVAAGIGVIVLAVTLTGVYIWQANQHFDAQNRKIVAHAKNEHQN